MVNQELQEKMWGLLPLVETRYTQTKILSEGGLECFKVSDKLVRYFCEYTEIYEKEKEFLIEWKKLKVSHGIYKRQYFLDLQVKAGERADKYNKPWLLALTPSGKAILKCDFLKTPECQNIMRAYNSDFDKAWNREYQRFSTLKFKQNNISSPHDMVGIIDKVCAECFKPLGFEKSQKYINSDRRLYLKHLHDDWYIYLIFDLLNIKNGVNQTESFFGIVKINKTTKNILNQNTTRSSFSYNDFLSLNDAEIGHYLKGFNSPQQLEAIIRINKFLYQLIVKLGFEEALFKN